MKKNTGEEEMILDRDVDTNGENEKENGFPFLGLLAMMSFRSLRPCVI